MKALRLFFSLAVAVALSMAATSCGDDKDSDSGKSGDGGSQGTESGLSESQKKEYIDQTGRELVGKINADDFRTITDLGQYVHDYLTDSKNEVKVVNDFFESAFNLCTLEENKTYVKRLFAMAYFSAQFEYRNGSWVKVGTEQNVLSFSFTDRNGQPCMAELTATGDEREMHASFFDTKDWHYDYYAGYYKTTEENHVKVPSIITLKILQGNAILASINATLKVPAGEFQYDSDAASTAIDATIMGYRVNLESEYNGGKNAAIRLTVSKKGETLVSANASSNLRLDNNGEFISAGNANIVIDVLGKVQAKGTVDDINKVRDLVEGVGRNTSESEVKSRVEQVNQQVHLAVYFDGNDTRQAFIKTYPFYEKHSYYNTWKIEPVICFGDGTSYSTFEEFGNDSRFKELIKKVEQLVTDFEHLVK
jgi:hypothetical protein